MLALFRATTPEDYHAPIEEDPRGSWRLIEGFAEMFASLAKRINRSVEAMFFMPHATASDIPASSGRRASCSVSIDRTVALDEVRTVESGAMRLRGVGGRWYRNIGTVTWVQDDAQPTKTMTFECEFPGFAGNLDHIADDSGKLTTQAGEPDTAALGFANQSEDRTGTAGQIAVSATGENSLIVDSGIGDRFVATDVGLYVRIEHHTDAANIGRVLRIVGFVEGVPDPLTGLARNVVEVDDSTTHTLMLSARAEDGGVFTDETTEANDATADDMTLLPAAPAVNDAYNFGSGTSFDRIRLDISTPGIGVWDLVGEYWNGSAWALLPSFVDGTLGFRQTGATDISWQVPGDWAQNTVDGVNAYHVRLRVSSFTSINTQPLGSTACTFNWLRLVNSGGTDGDTIWALLDWSDMGFRIMDIDAPEGGRDNDLYLLGDERGVYQQTDESDDDFRKRAAGLIDTNTPKAVLRAVNRALDPYGFRGEAMDVGNGFTGFFWDVDAFDYYEPGDLFPEDPWKLFQSEQEAKGWFLVVLPWIGVGDFGMFFDEGPVRFLDDHQEYLGPAWDVGFFDGVAVDADAAYRGIYETVDRIRLGFVGFTMIRDQRLNGAACP